MIHQLLVAFDALKGINMVHTEEYWKATGLEPCLFWDFFEEFGDLEGEVKKHANKAKKVLRMKTQWHF